MTPRSSSLSLISANARAARSSASSKVSSRSSTCDPLAAEASVLARNVPGHNTCLSPVPPVGNPAPKRLCPQRAAK